MATKNQVVVRFPPSPTGFLQLGNARTALFNYLWTKQQGGRLILRIEDTDRTRSKPEFEQNIIESLHWLGIEYDEFYRQSERTEIYSGALEQLILADKAYRSKEPVKDGGARTSVEVIRFRNPKKIVSFTDLIRGEISTDTTDLGDFVIARSASEPLYHLAVVVDDAAMGISHIIRGEDHIANTPRQILLQEALGAPRPAYAHLPLILAPDRSKLSKRHGAIPLTQYESDGYLPEAIFNYLALLGWNPGTAQEIFSREELIKQFDLSQVQKSGAIFNQEKLDWFNREYLRRLPRERLVAEIRHFLPLADETLAQQLAPEIINRIRTWRDLQNIAASGEFSYFWQTPRYDKTLLKTTKHLGAVAALWDTLPAVDFTAEKLKAALWDFATTQGRSEVLWPLRVALTGRAQSPDPFTVAAILGKSETLKRLAYAHQL